MTRITKGTESNVSFYRHGAVSIWMGEKFQAAFIAAMIEGVTAGVQ